MEVHAATGSSAAGEYLPADIYQGRLTADEPFPVDIDLTKLTR